MSRPTSRRRGLSLLAASALLVLAANPSHALASPSHGAPAPGPAQPSPNGGVTHTVTLLTGDKVTVTTLAGGRSVATVHRPHQLTGGVMTQTVGKDLYVYPTEALPYVASGALDKRLFDVTLLIADGYDDAHTAQLPLIVQYAKSSATRSRGSPAPARASSTAH